MSNVIVPLMGTESAMLNALSIGADDGRKTENGMVMGMREKLIELQKTCCKVCKECAVDCFECMAEHLLENGVTIPIRCGECIHRVKGTWVKCTGRRPDEFCSDGERKDNV